MGTPEDVMDQVVLYLRRGYSARGGRFEASAVLSGVLFEGRMAQKVALLDRNPQNTEIADPSSNNASKYLMWQDILTGLCDKNIEGYELDAHYAQLAEDLKAAVGRNGQFDGNFEFSYHAANVLAIKSQMGLRLTVAYKDGDREALENFARVELPDLRQRFIALRKVHMKNWFKIYKALGWDIMDMRYGSLLARIDSAIVEIEAYLSGEMERIEELEEERLYYGGKPGSIRYLNFFGDIVSPSRIAPKAPVPSTCSKRRSRKRLPVDVPYTRLSHFWQMAFALSSKRDVKICIRGSIRHGLWRWRDSRRAFCFWFGLSCRKGGYS